MCASSLAIHLQPMTERLLQGQLGEWLLLWKGLLEACGPLPLPLREEGARSVTSSKQETRVSEGLWWGLNVSQGLVVYRQKVV